MARKTITSANSILTLAVEGLYAGVRIQGFSTDLAFDMEPQQIAETRMGVDAKMSAGFVPQIFPMNIQLQADSDSIEVFDTIYLYAQSRREIVWITGTLEIPATRRSFAFSDGVLKNYAPFASHQRVQEPQRFTIDWGVVLSAKV
ncbi:MAG: hypothetical protein NC323_09280 [Oxalobacter formigenes]|nr:hypothetical protein [Oxalobacter formigenes]